MKFLVRDLCRRSCRTTPTGVRNRARESSDGNARAQSQTWTILGVECEFAPIKRVEDTALPSGAKDKIFSLSFILATPKGHRNGARSQKERQNRFIGHKKGVYQGFPAATGHKIGGRSQA